MNLVGKIFAFLVLLMSVVFMSLALGVYAAHKNWREVVENPTTGFKVRITQEQTKQQELKDEIDKLTAQVNEEDTVKRKALPIWKRPARKRTPSSRPCKRTTPNCRSPMRKRFPA